MWKRCPTFSNGRRSSALTALTSPSLALALLASSPSLADRTEKTAVCMMAPLWCHHIARSPPLRPNPSFAAHLTEMRGSCWRGCWGWGWPSGTGSPLWSAIGRFVFVPRRGRRVTRPPTPRAPRPAPYLLLSLSLCIARVRGEGQRVVLCCLLHGAERHCSACAPGTPLGLYVRR